MAQKLRIAHFLEQHQNYTLWIIQGEIQLELPHLLETQTHSLSRRAWLNFEDQACMDDVNLHIIVFKLMMQCRNILIGYIRRYTRAYFYFRTTMPGKAKIYLRFVRHLAQELPEYDFCQNAQSFYFCHRD